MYTLESLKGDIFELIKDQTSEYVKEDLLPDAEELFEEVASDIAQLKFEMMATDDEEVKQIKKKSIEKYYGVLKLKYAQKKSIFKSRSRKTATNVTYAIIKTIGKIALGFVGL